MGKDRKCSICGETGHDARNCPHRDANVPKDKILWVAIKKISDENADKLLAKIVKAKREIAPDAEACFAKGDKKSLPKRVHDALGFDKDKDKDKDNE